MSRAAGRPRRPTRGARRKRRTGLPDDTSVVSEKILRSPKGTSYRILTTTEVDPYDEPVGGRKKRR